VHLCVCVCACVFVVFVTQRAYSLFLQNKFTYLRIRITHKIG